MTNRSDSMPTAGVGILLGETFSAMSAITKISLLNSTFGMKCALNSVSYASRDEKIIRTETIL